MGMLVLRDCPDATVDICFVHGLTGDRSSTWTTDGHSEPWPKTFLPPKLSTARILTFGYDAYVAWTSAPSANRLIDHATDLLGRLTTNRAINDTSSRPLIPVAHSLGGLVCKEAVLMSRNNPEPHLRGAKIPASTLGFVTHVNRSLLQILETNDQFLESIRIRFLSMLRQQRKDGRILEVTCFSEELRYPVVRQVVVKDSATLDGYNVISIHANHKDMVKFPSEEDDGFQQFLGELVRWESQVRCLGTPRTGSVPQPSPQPVGDTSKGDQ
ncbi:hypothetical protein B0J18DRAFT_471510 [Chaetomium sp. MPI-SDFR-AT-0129]|nr:hypothetical protein B0J18DRAFT_471510 [Chaetomium sp. MPI-SDFR-AT-0129]